MFFQIVADPDAKKRSEQRRKGAPFAIETMNPLKSSKGVSGVHTASQNIVSIRI